MCLQFRLTVPRSRTNLPKKKKKKKKVNSSAARQRVLQEAGFVHVACGRWATRGPAGGVALG